MDVIFPKKLKNGSHIRVIAPSRSLNIISEETRAIANARLASHGFTVSFGKHTEEKDVFVSSSIESRIEDINDSFADSSVDAILTAIGGYNCNELLDYIDYNLIRNNPKILCGFSDITALSNAIFAKTGLVTYSGTHYSSWGMEKGFEFSEKHFLSCCANNQPFRIIPSDEWSDDLWFIDQNKRDFTQNPGYFTVNRGKEDVISGRIIGGNLGLLNILQGTEYLPDLTDSILFLEHCAEDHVLLFNRGIQSLIHQPSFKGVKALIIGRFQKENGMTTEMLAAMIKSKKELSDIPVIANADFGHTTPIITFPIGGTAEISFDDNQNPAIEISKF